MNIGLDFDGVIADTTALKLEVARERFGTVLDGARAKEELVIADGVMTQEQYRALMDTICHDPSVGMRMRLCENADTVIAKLTGDGHRLLIITSRSESETAIAEEWCRTHAIAIPFISAGYGQSKADVLKDRSIDAYIDDDLHKLEPLVGLVPYLFLYTAPHNRDLPVPPGITRVDWHSFGDAVSTLAQE